MHATAADITVAAAVCAPISAANKSMQLYALQLISWGLHPQLSSYTHRHPVSSDSGKNWMVAHTHAQDGAQEWDPLWRGAGMIPYADPYWQ